MSPDHPLSTYAALVRVEPELIGLPGKGLARGTMRRLRFVVHAAGWLHSMVLHGHIAAVTLTCRLNRLSMMIDTLTVVQYPDTECFPISGH